MITIWTGKRSVTIKEATTSELKNAIDAWTKSLADWQNKGKDYSNLVLTAIDQLAFLKAEYAGRIGKKR